MIYATADARSGAPLIRDRPNERRLAIPGQQRTTSCRAACGTREHNT
jgi:hypothetical protein